MRTAQWAVWLAVGLTAWVGCSIRETAGAGIQKHLRFADYLLVKVEIAPDFFVLCPDQLLYDAGRFSVRNRLVKFVYANIILNHSDQINICSWPSIKKPCKF